MKLRILNKNQISGVDTKYGIVPGTVYTDNYNETLDSMTISVCQQGSKIDIEPLDIVWIYADDGTTVLHYFCVDSYSCSQVSFSDPIYYQYEINLVSQTKLLEGIILPSLKITQLKSGTRRTIKYYLDQYLSEYGEKIRLEDSSFTSKWHFSNDVNTRFNVTECPEMQWNQPTLRQVLTDLMMVDDCIPVLRNNEIDFIDISVIGDEISTACVSQVQESQSSEDYVSELRVELKNVMQSKQEGVNDIVTASEYIGFRNSDNYVINDNNYRLEVKNPILEIVKVELYGTGEKHSGYWIPDLINGRNITQYIKEYDEWRTLPVKYDNRWEQVTHADLGQYQNTCLYYKRYGTSIEGFYQTDTHSIFINKTLLEIMLYWMVKDTTLWISVDGYRIDVNHLKTLGVKITYKTTASSLFQASKSSRTTNNKVVTDNQTNSYVDSYAQGLLEYMKVNRLGNQMKLIDARYLPTDTIPSLGQTYNGAVIFKRELAYYDDYVDVNFWATPEYVLRDYFTGVQAKIRSWKIVDKNEALERHELIKYYLEFSDIQHETDFTVFWEGYFLNIFNIGKVDYEIKPMVYGAVYFYGESTREQGSTFYPPKDTLHPGPIPPSHSYYLSDLSTRLSGNSLLFTFGFDDNYKAGTYIDRTITTELNGMPQNYYRYVNDDGENFGGEIYLTDGFESNVPEIPESYDETFINEYGSAMEIVQSMRPKCFGTEIVGGGLSSRFSFHKDNSEITRITVQYEFCAEHDIVFGSKFLETQSAVLNTLPATPTWNFIFSDEKPTFRNKDYVPTQGVISTTATIDAVITSRYIEITPQTDNQSKKYCYLLFNNELMLAFPNQNTATKTLYLNFLLSRDKRYYSTDFNIPDGEI